MVVHKILLLTAVLLIIAKLIHKDESMTVDVTAVSRGAHYGDWYINIEYEGKIILCYVSKSQYDEFEKGKMMQAVLSPDFECIKLA